MKKPNLHWQINLVLLSVLITVVVYIGVSIWAGWHDVWAVVQRVGWLGLGVALLLSLLNYLLRFGRWQYYLTHLGYRIDHRTSWRIYLSGFALTTTPGKAGEIIRSVFLNRYGVPTPTSVAAFVSERLSDLIAIVLLSCIGLMEYPTARMPVSIAGILLLSIWFMLMYRPALLWLQQRIGNQTGKIWQLAQKGTAIIEQAQRCHDIHTLFFTTMLSVLAWGMEAFAFHLLLQWCGFDLSWHFAFFVYAVSMLVGALSFLPGGLGGAEATMISLLLLKGVDMETAVACTLFIRFTTLWFAVILGIGALWRQRQIY